MLMLRRLAAITEYCLKGTRRSAGRRPRGLPGCSGSFVGVEALEARHLMAGDPLANFALRDVNTRSDTYNNFVTPRQFEGQISAWYFGHAT